MGRPKTTIIQPSPPPQPSTAEAIREWAETLPVVYETQLQYLPRFATLAQAISEQLYPKTAAIQETLAREALQQAQAGEVPESIREQYLSNLRANLGTNIGSPIGAEYTSRQLLNLQQDWRNYYRNLALSLAEKQQLVQPPSFQTMTGGFTPAGVMGYRASTYGTYAPLTRPIVGSTPSPWSFGWSPEVGLSIGYQPQPTRWM